MSQGKIIEYIERGKFICTLCLQDKGNSLHLLTTGNREVKLPPKRALLISEKSIDTKKTREELLEILRQTEKKRNHLIGGIDIQELWELVKDENENFDNRYLAHLIFGQEITDDHLSAVVRALFQDRLHFKMKDGRFHANSEEKVEQILRQREEEKLREERLLYGSAWLRDVQSDRSPEDPPHKEYIVNLLKHLALYGADTIEAKYGKEMLAKAGISDVRKARHILTRLGIWETDENLDLVRFGIATSFTEKQLNESSRLAGAQICYDGREDLRDLFVLTIDGPQTGDFDDAVSLETIGDELRLGIHIADVSEIISPDSILDKEAAKRATTLYLARRQIPMIPHDLSHDALSLIQGCDRPAISLFARFSKNGKLLGYRFVASIVKVHQKLTYEAVDKFLSEKIQVPGLDLSDMERLTGMLPDLYQLTRRLQQERMGQDALRLSLPELRVVFNSDSSISLVHDDQDTPSRMIIAELMIFYNCLAARFCRDNNVPVLFRTQAEPSERLSEDEGGYVYYVFKQRRKLSPAYIDTESGRHSGLGVDAYIQVTSPIRRYFDLVVQRQLRNFLMGEALTYTKKELEEIRTFVEPVVKDLMAIKRNRIRYWVLKYLSQHQGNKYRAVVIDELRRKYRIVLYDFFLVAEIHRQEGTMIRPGTEIEVEVKMADPRDDVIQLEYAK